MRNKHKTGKAQKVQKHRRLRNTEKKQRTAGEKEKAGKQIRKNRRCSRTSAGSRPGQVQPDKFSHQDLAGAAGQPETAGQEHPDLEKDMYLISKRKAG